MYSNQDKEEALREIRKYLEEKLIDDKKMPLTSFSYKMMKFRFYVKMNLAEKVRFYLGIWKMYCLVVFALLSIAAFMGLRITCVILWLAANFLILAGYLVLKLSYLRKFRSKNHRQEKEYEPDVQSGQWFLKEEYKQRRRFWFFMLMICVAFFFVVEIGLFSTEYLYFTYPAIIFVFEYEMWQRYCWLTKEEYYNQKFGMKAPEGEQTSIAAICKKIKELFSGQAVLGYGANHEETRNMTLEELEIFFQGESHANRMLQIFCAHNPGVVEKGKGLLETALELLENRSVLFQTAFYRDLDYAFILSAYLKLVRGQTVLLVAATNVRIEKMTEWIRDGVKKLNGMEWWTFSPYRPFHKPGQLVAVYCSDFDEFCRDEKYGEFRENIGIILLQDPSEYSSHCMEQIRALWEAHEAVGEICMAVCSASAEAINLVNWSFQTDRIYKGQLWRTAKRFQTVYWKEENLKAEAGLPREWGIEMDIFHCLVQEVKSGDIVWIGGEMLPVWDFLWAYKGRYTEDVGKNVILEEYGLDLQWSKEVYIIAEDYAGNYKKVLDTMVSRGWDKAMVNVIAPNYMLRDFIQSFQANPLITEGLTAQRVETAHNVAWRLMHMLLQEWVGAGQIKKMMDTVHLPGHKWGNTLRKQIGELFRLHILEKNEEVELESIFRNEEEYRLKKNETIKTHLRKEESIYFVEKNKGKLTDISTNLTYNTVYQVYLPGQNVVLNNKSYKFIGVFMGEDRYYAEVERNSGTVKRKTYYRQHRRYALSDVGEADNNLRVRQTCPHIHWKLEKADILVETCGYLEMEQFRGFGNANYRICRHVPERKYKKKPYIKIQVEVREEREARIIATWLKEAFYTLCRKYYDYLAVGMEGVESVSLSSIEIRETPEKKTVDLQKNVKPVHNIYIIEDMDQDSGILWEIYEKQNDIMLLLGKFLSQDKGANIEPFMEDITR